MSCCGCNLGEWLLLTVYSPPSPSLPWPGKNQTGPLMKLAFCCHASARFSSLWFLVVWWFFQWPLSSVQVLSLGDACHLCPGLGPIKLISWNAWQPTAHIELAEWSPPTTILYSAAPKLGLSLPSWRKIIHWCLSWINGSALVPGVPRAYFSVHLVARCLIVRHTRRACQPDRCFCVRVCVRHSPTHSGLFFCREEASPWLVLWGLSAAVFAAAVAAVVYRLLRDTGMYSDICLLAYMRIIRTYVLLHVGPSASVSQS